MAPEPVEHKLAAILSADVVGYSRLMAEDEAATIRTLTDYREQIAVLVRQHRGRVVDTPGDNVLAEFPTALEAVRCAVEMQGVLRARNVSLPAERRMDFRIGVHMGDVAAEGGRIYGDGVNIAARLEGLAEAGGVCISATVHEQVRNKVDAGFTDLGDQTIKNVPEQVRVYRVQPRGQSEAPAGTKTASGKGLRIRTAHLAAAAILLLLALGIWASWPRPLGLLIDFAGVSGPPVDPPLPDRPSIAVLPFANISGDPEQEYFSDGITEDLTTELSRNPFLFVIARNSAFTYKGRAVDVEDVGRELGVRYLLEGSVRKADSRVRITAQLIDATTGFHLWSERYDRELADIFALQTEISQEILTSINVKIVEAESERIRRKPTANLTAYDRFQKALYHQNRFTRADTREARRLLERAIELDPGYAQAYSLLGGTYAVETGFGWNYDPSLLDRAEELARKALAIDPALPTPHVGLAAIHIFRGQGQRAVEEADLAIAGAPNLDAAHFFRGMGLAQQGDYLAALQSVKQALRLNPRATSGYMVIVAAVNMAAGRRQEAIKLLERLRTENPELINARIPLAAIYEEAGRHDEARAVVHEILAVNPDLNTEQALDVGGLDVMIPAETGGELLRRAGLP